MDLEAFLTAEIYRGLLVFCRIGTAMMVMPGLGEAQVPMQLRLMLALVLGMALAHAVPGVPLQAPESLGPLVRALLVEIFVGFWIGAVARILLASLHFLGHKIASVSALSNALGGTSVFENGTIFSSLLTLSGVAIIFMADIHHVAITGLMGSYSLIPLGELPSLANFADLGTRAVAESFLMGFRFAAPFLILGIIVNAGMGLANRVMPSLPVYFVAAPLLVGGGVLLLLVTIGALLLVFADRYADWWLTFSF